MIVDLLNWLLTRNHDRAGHDAVARRLRDDRDAWVAQRSATPTAEAAAPHKLRPIVTRLSMAAAVLIGVTLVWRLGNNTNTDQAGLNTQAISELNVPTLLAMTDQAAGSAFDRQWQTLADDARAGLELVLTPLPSLPHTAEVDPS